MFIYNAPAGAATWNYTTIWDATAQSGDSTWSDYNGATRNYRQIIQSSYVTADANTVRLGIQGHSTQSELHENVGICTQKTSGPSPRVDCDSSTLVNVTFNSGADTFTAPANDVIWSDCIAKAMASNDDYLVTLFVQQDTNNYTAYLTQSSAGGESSSGSDESQTEDVSGYSTYNFISLIAFIQACEWY